MTRAAFIAAESAMSAKPKSAGTPNYWADEAIEED
jgi:hypothetical protein